MPPVKGVTSRPSTIPVIPPVRIALMSMPVPRPKAKKGITIAGTGRRISVQRWSMLPTTIPSTSGMMAAAKASSGMEPRPAAPMKSIVKKGPSFTAEAT